MEFDNNIPIYIQVIHDIEKDIIGLKQAINIIENIEDDENYKKVIKNKLFKGKCSKECYY